MPPGVKPRRRTESTHRLLWVHTPARRAWRRIVFEDSAYTVIGGSSTRSALPAPSQSM